jgi:autotransporter-associated beta strand protein
VLSGGGLQFSANNTYDYTTSGRLQLADGATGIIHDGGQSVTFANPIGVGAAATGALIKQGTGTLTLSAANTFKGATTISGGTLALGANSALSVSTAVTLGAATLDAEIFTNSVSTLDVTNAGTINLGSGGTLAFADSHLKSWSGGTLNITGTFVSGSSIRFGTDANGLTTAQKNAITVNGSGAGTYGLNSSGYLVVTSTPPYQPVLSSANLVNGGLVLQFSGTNGQSYKVLSSTNLNVALSNWTAVSSGTLTGSTVNYTNAPTTDPQRFFIITSP